MNLLNYNKYLTRTDHVSVFCNIPISEYDKFRNCVKQEKVDQFRYRFRGPRNNVASAKTRSSHNRQSFCLREDATYFSVYHRI